MAIKNISEININNTQIVASSFSTEINKPLNALFHNNSYWEPNLDDETPYIQFNFENIYEIALIDIKGKLITKDDLSFGYVSKFKISYFNSSNKWVVDNTIYTGVEINNVDYIKKIYLTTPIISCKIKIFPIEYVNIKALKIKFYKINYPKINIYNYLCYNTKEFANFNKTIFDYKFINEKKYITDTIVDDFKYNINILNTEIKEGI